MNTRRGTKKRVRAIDKAIEEKVMWNRIGLGLSLFAMTASIIALPFVLMMDGLKTEAVILAPIFVIGMVLMTWFGKGDLDAFDDNEEEKEELGKVTETYEEVIKRFDRKD